VVTRDLGCLTKLGSLHRRQWTAPQWSQQHRCHLWLSGRLETKQKYERLFRDYYFKASAPI